MMLRELFGIGFVSFSIYILYLSAYDGFISNIVGILITIFFILDLFAYYKYRKSVEYRFLFYWSILIFSICISYLYLRFKNICGSMVYLEDIRMLPLLLIMIIAVSYVVSIFLYKNSYKNNR